MPPGSGGSGGSQAWQPSGSPSGSAPRQPYQAARLPSAPRERKPALAALAVLLILAGALATTMLVIQSGKKISVVKIVQNVPAGSKIPASAIEEVQVSSQNDPGYIDWNQANDLTNRWYSRVGLVPGTLLVHNMIQTSTVSMDGKRTVGVTLKEGTFPPSIAAGQQVNVWNLIGNGSTNTQIPTSPIVENAVIISVKAASGSGLSNGEDVSLLVDEAQAGAVAQASLSGTIALTGVPSIVPLLQTGQ